MEIVQPVFVCGLARAGTTILLETLAGHPELGSHRYRDDPFVFTPMLWDAFLARLPNERTTPAERAHADRSEEHTSELQSLMRISYAVFCLKKNTDRNHQRSRYIHQ